MPMRQTYTHYEWEASTRPALSHEQKMHRRGTKKPTADGYRSCVSAKLAKIVLSTHTAHTMRDIRVLPVLFLINKAIKTVKMFI